MHSPDYDPKQWLPWPSVRWQAFWVAAIGVVVYVVAAATLTPTLAAIETLVTTLWHEGWHAAVLAAFGGTVSDIAVNADGSGHASGRATSDLHQIGVSASGPLGEALIGAITLYAALTRRGMHIVFVIWGVVSLWVCHWYVRDTVVCLTLYTVGFAALTLAYIPLHGTWKAPFLMFLAIVMGLGVIRGIDYAYVAYIGDPREMIPSDSQKIADILDTNIDQVGTVLVGVIIAIYGITGALIANFLQRNN